MSDVEVGVARGAASLYLASVVSLVLNTVYFVILTNFLAAEEVGLVSLLNVFIIGVVTASTLAAPVVGSGLSATPPAVTRFLSEYISEGRGSDARKVFLVSLLLAGVISTTLGLVLASKQVATSIAFPQNPEPVVYAAIDAIIYSVGQVGAYSLIGAGRATSAGSAIIGSSIARYVTAAGFIFLGFGPSGVFIGFSVGDAILLLLSLLLVSRSVTRGGSGAIDKRLLMGYMLTVLAAGAIGFGVSQADRLIPAIFKRGFGDLAVYNVASVGAAVAAFAPSALTNVLVPTLGVLHDREETRRAIMRKYTRYVGFVTFPMGFGLAAISPWLLRLFGERYVTASPLVSIMAIAVSISSVGSVYASSLLSGQRTYLFLLGNFAGLVTLIAVAYVLVPFLGLLGVALARASMLLVVLGAFALLARMLGDLVLDTRAYLKSFLGSAVMGGIIYGAMKVLTSVAFQSRLGSVLLSVVMIPFGSVVYLATMKLLKGFDGKDVDFLKELLPRFLSRIAELARRFT